jgi:hypothetical protein
VAEWHSADDPNNRDKINRARQAAEQLFKPMPPHAERDLPAPAGNTGAPAEQDRRRQPRIFAMPPRVPIGGEPHVSPAPKPAPPPPAARRRSAGVAPSQFGRIRALATYGMTREQVADLYGVTVDEIAQILNYPLGAGAPK